MPSLSHCKKDSRLSEAYLETLLPDQQMSFGMSELFLKAFIRQVRIQSTAPGADYDGKGYSAIEKLAIFAYPIVHVRCISSISIHTWASFGMPFSFYFLSLHSPGLPSSLKRPVYRFRSFLRFSVLAQTVGIFCLCRL